MDWRGVENYDRMSEWGANAIFQAVAARMAEGRRFNLGLATGNTMIGLYRLLAQRLNREKIDLALLHTYNLDEYVGPDGKAVSPDHLLSYRRYMNEHLFSALAEPLGFQAAQAHFPDPVDPESFDRELESAGGLEFQLLGIGFNGHIAFNEPMPEDEISAAEFGALTSRVVALEELTIQTNSRLTAGDDDALVPRHAATMGMRQILAAKEILLLACFPEQVTPLGKMLADPRPNPELPASYLVDHPAATIVYTRDVISLDPP